MKSMHPARYRTPRAWLAPLIVPLAFWSGSALAQDTSEDARMTALRACQATVDPTARLACYDRAVGEVVAATDAGELQVVDREEIRETRRGLFGFSLPKLGIFGGGDDDKDDLAKKMNTTITGVRTVGREGWQITIAEGSVWQISEAPRRFRPQIGDDVELERAAMGSYWVRLKGQNGVKGRRIE